MAGTPVFRVEGLWKVFGAKADRVRPSRARQPDPGRCVSARLHGGRPRLGFDVRKGEVFVVMGLSALGKSTLVRCLTG